MTRKVRKKTRALVKCPWCFKHVGDHRGHIERHLTPGGLPCIGIGMATCDDWKVTEEKTK